MQGRPSLKNYGIHILIKKELEAGKKVEIFMIISASVKAMVKGLFGQEKMKVSAFKEMEYKCQSDYFEREGEYPLWNFQERVESWSPDLQREHSDYISKTIKK